MYLYQPCLLTLALHAWAYDENRIQRRLRILFSLSILILSGLELTGARVYVYPGALLLPALFSFDRLRSASWAEVLTSSLLGGLLSWKAAYVWPLLPGSKLLCSVLLLIPAAFLIKKQEDRLLACSLGSLIFELLFCLKEYTLFSFCVIRLGSRDALSLGSMAACILTFAAEACRRLFPKEKRVVSMGN